MTPRSSQEQTVNPKMIILGREARGLSQQKLADALGVKQSLVSMIEMEQRRFPDDLLQVLSETIHYPPHFFYQKAVIRSTGITEVFHRKRKKVPKRIMDKIDALINLRIQHIEALLDSAEPPPVKIKPIDMAKYEGNIEQIAEIVRADLDLPRGPIEDLTQTLENAGILIASFDFETELDDAQSRRVDGLPPMMFMNGVFPKDRLRFSLAHELGHLVMHSSADPDMEDQADRFAAEFLLPRQEILPYLEDLNLVKLTHLKRYWKVSMQAILKRAEDLGAVSTNQARGLWVQLNRAGYKLHEPIELDMRGERPRLLYELAEFHMKDLKYSEEGLQAILPLDFDELREQYLEDPYSPHPHLKVIRA